jgi:hypothetical protein
VSRPNRRQWTRDEILHCGLEWIEEFEEAPTSAEWGAGLVGRVARLQAKLDLMKRKRAFHKDGKFPSVAAVRNHFDDWQKFIAALGITPAQGKQNLEQRATRARQARELTALGPIHVRLLFIIQRGGIQQPDDELQRQAIRQRLPDGWGDQLDELLDSGYVEHVSIYRLTERGRVALRQAVADPAEFGEQMSRERSGLVGLGEAIDPAKLRVTELRPAPSPDLIA